MKKRVFITGAIFLIAMLVNASNQECVLFSDPNDYVDDPYYLDNGHFECGDPNLTEFAFTPPIFWERLPYIQSHFSEDCFAGLYESFDPPNGTQKWIIDSPFEGNTFVLMSSGGFISKDETTRVADSQISGSRILQQVDLSAGDTISGAFFFGTLDYLPFNDSGHISLIYTGDPNDFEDPNDIPVNIDPIPGTYCDVEIVGDKQSTITWDREDPNFLPGATDGWVSFSYTVDANQAGPYIIMCEVKDHRDSIVNSYYAVDGLRICKGGIPETDLDKDCDVDLADLSIFSKTWMCFCPDPPVDDPNFPGDPNNYPLPPSDPNLLALCESTDFDNSWFIDPNDLSIMADEWLIDNSH